VTFEKNSYSPLEDAKIYLRIDNSQCEKDLKHIEVKLWRVIDSLSNKKNKFNCKKVMCEDKYVGVEAGKCVERELVLRLNGVN
jgi:hypothetical protein